MAKYQGPNFILELKLYPQDWQKDILEHLFYCSERMYNQVVYHANGCIDKLRKDPDYIKTLELYTKETDEKIKKQYGSHLAELREQYGLTKNDFEKYIKDVRNKSYQNTIDSNTSQKISNRVWKAVEKCLFGNGKKVHFKKFKTLDSVEGKSNKTGIRFNKECLVLTWNKMVIPVKVRKNDYYAKEALENEISFCRIIRRPFKTGYKYFIQITFKGLPPIKPNRIPGTKKGNVGIDIGPSTIAVIGKEDGLLETLAPLSIKDCNKKIIRLSRKLERIRRASNPDNYNEDGTCKKGKHYWVKTKNYYNTLFELKNMYRLRNLYLREHQAILQKNIMSYGDNFATEEINFVSWARKSKKATEQTDKEVEKTDKNGNKKKYKKCKRKKRFGKSLNNHSPGKFIQDLKKKLGYFGIEIEEVNTQKFRASQYNHDTDTYQKVTLDQRKKEINGKEVQRDLYSAFVMANRKDKEHVDRNKCIQNFDNFLKTQDRIIKNLQARGDILPACMGI